MYSRNEQKDKRPYAGVVKMKIIIGTPTLIASFIYSVLTLTVGGAI